MVSGVKTESLTQGRLRIGKIKMSHTRQTKKYKITHRRQSQKGIAAEQSMLQTITQVAMEVAKAAIVVVKKEENLVNAVRST